MHHVFALRVGLAWGAAGAGGSWLHGPQFLRSAGRYYDDARFRHIDVGFRVARTLGR
jgi:formylglycine-generating enzyme required for sulfatase activity